MKLAVAAFLILSFGLSLFAAEQDQVRAAQLRSVRVKNEALSAEFKKALARITPTLTPTQGDKKQTVTPTGTVTSTMTNTPTRK